jgi:hypothetical protein
MQLSLATGLPVVVGLRRQAQISCPSEYWFPRVHSAVSAITRCMSSGDLCSFPEVPILFLLSALFLLPPRRVST